MGACASQKPQQSKEHLPLNSEPPITDENV